MVKGCPRRVKGVYMVPISCLYRSYILAICSAFLFQVWFPVDDSVPLTGCVLQTPRVRWVLYREMER